ncbi:ferredoxin--nitrite reductase [Cyanobium sp.]|jgi:hypothetical protein|nr:ferredoxin--nitrite reductase [Cyanobium sp.]
MTGLSTSDRDQFMQAGDQVRVSSNVVVFTHPEHRGAAYDLQGQQGEVVQVLEDWKGRPISPNLPVIVAFGRFRAHFRAEELSPL